MNSGGNKPEDDHTEDKDTSKNAENTDNKLQRDDQNKDERKKLMNTGSDQPDDEQSDNEGTSKNTENIDNEPQRVGQNKDESTLVEKPSLAEEKALKYDNLIKTLRTSSQDLQLEGNLKEDTSENKKRIEKKKIKTESDMQYDDDILFAKVISCLESQNQRIRKLQEDLDLAQEQVDKYDRLIQTLRKFGKELGLQENLEQDNSKKEKGSKKQHFQKESDVEHDNDILVKAMSSFKSLIQQIREVKEEKEKLKTETAYCKEEHRKRSEKLEAAKKTLKQNVKERDDNIKSLNAENEKLSKALKKNESSLKDKERVNAELCEKQTKLQLLNEQQNQTITDLQTSLRQMQSDNERYRQTVHQQSQRIQDQDQILQYMGTEVKNLKKALHESNEERDDLTTRLSKLAGACLTRENPNITDLSDKNRPTKLAERYSELYDNEWTDAYEELCVQKHMEEVQCIKALLDLLKATNDECVQLTKPNSEILRTLTRVSITLHSDCIRKEQSAGTENHNLARSTKPDMVIKRDDSRSTFKESEKGPEEMEIEYSPAETEFGPNEDNVQDEIQACTGKIKDGEMKDKDSTQFEKLQTAQRISKTECVPNENKVQDETHADNGQPSNVQEPGKQTENDSNEGQCQDVKRSDNGQPNDVQVPGKQTENDSNEGQCQDEKQSDNGQPNDVQEKKDKVKTIPEGFSSNVDTGEELKDKVKTIPEGFLSNVDTGEVSTEVVIDVKFSEEQMKTISDMRRLSAILFETEKNISKLIAEKIAFERGIDTKRWVKVMAFITKCAKLCWYMAIQELPVVIEFHEPVDDELFDKDKYKAYTEMGDKLEYVVWPPLYLHSGGAMLCKGTAQGKK